ncbi:MAG TPA: DUF11 domain-containing protein [Acholeplasmataceae bacterium]|jgi:uncharacterized repeat protein (TIGR01451 family)|nr:DUF11 domain-containing protein [Acholeplasmataceae bacterium]
MIVRSQASVSYAYSLGNLRINSVVSSNAVDTEIRTVKLLGKKTASHEFFRPGDVITYNLVITNTGNFAASNVLIEDELSYQKLVEGSFTYSFLENSKAEARLLEKAGGLAFEIDELRPYEVCIISYRTVVDDIRDTTVDLRSAPTIRSKEIPATPAGELLIKQRYAHLECEKKCVDFAYLNTDISYLLTLKNTGNATAYDIEITDQLPQTFELAKSPDTVVFNKLNLDIYTFDQKTRLLKIYIDKMEPGETAEIVINGKIVK